VTGLRVPPSDPAALAEALRALLVDPARTEAMGKDARARADRLYALDKAGEAVVRALTG
jgi:glycosyltransferase involved in cell wall biosynthesis